MLLSILTNINKIIVDISMRNPAMAEIM